jgi:hypothetical protein
LWFFYNRDVHTNGDISLFWSSLKVGPLLCGLTIYFIQDYLRIIAFTKYCLRSSVSCLNFLCLERSCDHNIKSYYIKVFWFTRQRVARWRFDILMTVLWLFMYTCFQFTILIFRKFNIKKSIIIFMGVNLIVSLNWFILYPEISIVFLVILYCKYIIQISKPNKMLEWTHVYKVFC